MRRARALARGIFRERFLERRRVIKERHPLCDQINPTNAIFAKWDVFYVTSCNRKNS